MKLILRRQPSKEPRDAPSRGHDLKLAQEDLITVTNAAMPPHGGMT